MRRARFARTRALLGAVIAGLALTAVISPHDTASAATAPTEFVRLRGGGAWSVYGPLVAWQNDLENASSFINLGYSPRGTTFGREDLVNKNSDFVISGMPFTTDELQQLGGSKALISAPVQATALAVYVEPTYTAGQPQFQFFRHRHSKDGIGYCDPDDDTTWPPGVTNPDDCYARENFNGPVRIPNANLGAMLLNVKVGGDPPTSAWNNPDVLRALGLNPDAGDAVNTAGPDVGPGTALRSDPDELNYFLGAYVKAVAPDAWNVASNNMTAPSESRLASQGWTRDGAEQQIQLLASHGCGVTGDGCGTTFAPSGGLAPTPPALKTAFQQAFQTPGPACCQPILTAQVQNQHQDWVDPSPDAISKAVAAGGETPFYALNHDAPGAYPLTWVDRMYAPAKGLSVAKTEGLATLMRYLATTGQDKEAAVLEGRLSPALTAQTLAAADAVVQGNCTGTDRAIVKNSDPGPLAPPDATAMSSIGPMLHCVAVAPPAPTTTTPIAGSNGSGSDGGSGFVPGSSSFSGNGSTDSGASSSTGSSGGTTANASANANTGAGTTSNDSPDVVAAKRAAAEKRQSQLVVATDLPLPIPTGQTGRDRLATFLLGVGLYFLLRKPTVRLFQRLSR